MTVVADAFELGDIGSGGPAVLCLHGLSGTPWEVRGPAEALAQSGFACLGPLLPGHGTSPDLLANTPRQSWRQAARDACDRLLARHDPVFVMGLSMGGVLALDLCAERRLGGGLVMAAPLELGAAARWLLPLLARIMPFLPARSDIHDPEARAEHPSYDRMPIAAVLELVALGREVAALLPRIAVPLHLIYSRRDRVVPLENASRIARNLGRKPELTVLEGSGHVLPVDRERDRVAELAVRFFSGLLPAPLTPLCRGA